MKRFLSIAFVLTLLLLFISPKQVLAAVYGSSGEYGYSEATAWEINSPTSLIRFRDDVNGQSVKGSYFKLTKDIDLTLENEWIPIGGGNLNNTHNNPFIQGAGEHHPFSGHFDGNGHTIKINIVRNIQNSDAFSSFEGDKPMYNGLFGLLMDGSIKNLNVSGNVDITIKNTTNEFFVGGIVGYLCEGSIENCKFDGTVSATYRGSDMCNTHVGGITGYAGSGLYIFSIKNCKVGSISNTVIKAKGNHVSDISVGGIVGYLYDNAWDGEISEVSGNWAKVTLSGKNYGSIYGKRENKQGHVYNNTEIDPNEEELSEITFDTNSLPDGEVGATYEAYIETNVKDATTTWSWSGNTPSTANLKIFNGLIYGTPTKAGDYSFTVKVSATGYEDGTKEFNLKIKEQTPSGLEINSTNFPDPDFRSYIASKTIDKDGNGYLSDNEILEVTSISVSNLSLSNLKGIEIFTALEELVCDNNYLKALDLSANIALKALYCSDNKLTSLNLSKNKALEILECNNNQLTALDVSNNTVLEHISCYSNKLQKLDVTSNSRLKYLDCNDNQLTELTLGNNSVLEEVYCYSNSSLKTLDITNCTKLSNDNVHVDAEIKLISNGKGTETPEIGGEDELPEFGGSTLVLDGKIGINFYVYLPEGYDPENCYMVFESRRGVSNENPVQKYDPNFYSIRRGKKYYAYTCYINSAQMAEEITATFHFNGNTIIKKDSVDGYLTLAKQNESMFSENVNNLMKAIRNYGHYVQPMLAINGKWTIGDKYAEMQRASEITDEDIEDAKSKVTQYAKIEYKNSTGITKNVGYSLNLDADTVLNLTFTPLATYNGSVSINVDGKAADVKKVNENNTTKYKIEISNISAPDLGKTFSVTAEANGINMVNISALSYAQAVLNANVERVGEVPIDIMKQAVTALYRYHVAAKTYFDNGKQ